jgi:hypothetical protein
VRSIAGVAIIVFLVGVVAACTIVMAIAAFDAATVVGFTSYGIDDTLTADDWQDCDDFQSYTCR